MFRCPGATVGATGPSPLRQCPLATAWRVQELVAPSAAAQVARTERREYASGRDSGARIQIEERDDVRVVIMGCGRVGAQLATMLDRDGHHVTVLDVLPDAFRRLPPSFKGVTM